MHRLLKRQIKKLFGEIVPQVAEISPLLNLVDESYYQFQEDYNKLERILELSSKESFKELSNFKNAIDTASLVSLTDAKATIIMANENFCKISGFSLGELVGQNHNIINSEYHPKSFWKEVWQTIGSGNIWQGEICNKTKSGELYWVDSTIIPFLDDLGKPYQYLSIRFDITNRKKIEEEIKTLALVAQKTQNAVIITDTAGVAIWANEGFERITEYSVSDLIGKKPGQLLQGKNTDPETKAQISMALREGKPFSGEILNYSKTKRPYWISLSITPMMDNDKHMGFIAIEGDISERKKIEFKLRENEKLLKAINDASAELLANTNFENSVSKAIEIIGKAFKVNRVHIFKNNSDLNGIPQSFSQRFVWLNDNNQIIIDNPELQNIPYIETGMVRWRDEFTDNKIVKGVVSDFPIIEQPRLLQDGLASIIALPVFLFDSFWGFLALDSKDEDSVWNENHEQMLLNVVRNIASTFERNDSELRLKENEEKFRLLIESATDIFYYTDGFGNFTYVNDISTQITGYSTEELLRMNYLDLVQPDNRNRVESFYKKQSLLGNKVTYNEFPIITKSGKKAWIGQNVQLIQNANNVNGIQAIARDITTLKNAQIEIENSHNFLNEIIDSIPNPLFVKNRNHEWIMVNNAYTQLTGISKKKIIGKKDNDFLTEIEANKFILQDEEQFKNQNERVDEVIYKNEEDKEKILLVKKSIYQNQTDFFLIALITDITEIKEREKEILLYNKISDQISDAISVADYEGNLIYVNEAHANNLQKSKENLIGSSIVNMEKSFPTLADWQKHYNEVKYQGEQLIEGVNKRANGTEFPVEASVKYVNIENKGYVVAAIRDITERKKSEEKIREGENRFKSLVQNATDITTVLDINGNVTYESPSFYRVFGYDEEEVVGKSIFSFIHQDDVERVQIEFKKGVVKGGISDPVIFRFKRKDGKNITIETIGNNLLNEPGINGIVVNSRDISERIKAEEEVRNLKEFYENVLNKIPSDVVVFNKDHKYLFINEIAVRDVEKRKWLIGHDDYEYCEHYNKDIKLADGRRNLFNTVLNNKKQLEFEEKIVKAGEKPVWVLRRFYPVLDKEGEINTVIGFGIDITTRKEAEDKIKESEERLSLATSSANLGIWDWNLKDNSLIWDSSMYRIFDVNPNDFTSDYDAFEKTLHVEDKERVNQEIKDALANNYDFKGLFRIVSHDGSIKYISAVSKTFRDSQQQPIRMIGVNFDVTETTLIQHKILKQQKDLEEAQHIARVGGWEIDVLARTILWSKEMFSICEIADEKQPSLNETYDFFTSETRELVIQSFFNAIEKHQEFEIESKLKTGKGKIIDVKTKGIPFSQNGKVVAIRGILQDISQEKEASRLMVQYTEELEKKNKELDQFAYVVSHDLKAPLRGINNLSMWIEEDMEGKIEIDTKNNLDLMRKRVKRMEGLIDGILQYSRAGRIKHESVTFNLKESIEELITNMSPSENFKISIQEDLPTLTTEKIAIEQVFANYISNAIKYNSNPEPTIAVTCNKTESFYEFCVADNGPGIEKEFFEKVFVIFQTLQARDTFESTGVGLAIVKKMVEDKGGKVWIESEMGKGSKFYFSWPIIDTQE
ncbi:MAG: PAS domain S-box protein [Bacteroidia bacterium]|nr:PAS domain S-box protein [Bacteroidia bacterium]MCF8426286.1 PAS domain S-box protein [Bacteroidia bacterium]